MKLKVKEAKEKISQVREHLRSEIDRLEQSIASQQQQRDALLAALAEWDSVIELPATEKH